MADYRAQRATVAMGLRRAGLRRGIAAVAGGEAERRLYAMYADALAASPGVVLSFDEFLGLPEAEASEWIGEVYTLNPHWMPGPDDEQPADGLIARLTGRQQRLNAAIKGSPELPETVILNDEAGAYELWQLLEATDWRWPPDVLLRQDERLLYDVMTIAGLAQSVKKLLETR